jgi:hypothetical protein
MNSSTVTSVKPKWTAVPMSVSRLPMSCIQLADSSRLSISLRSSDVSIEEIKENRSRRMLNLSSLLKEDCHVDFPNYDFYLRRQVLKSESVNDLKEKLLAINRWCFLTVGVQGYGFYSPDVFSRGPGDYIRIVDSQGYLDAYACAVFKNSNDALAFKLKF